MHLALISVLLLDVAYFDSPLAQCMDTVSADYLIGKWEPRKNGSSHEIDTSSDGVYMITDKMFLVRKLTYDGEGPRTQFVIGTTDEPDSDGATCFYNNVTDMDYALPKLDGTMDLRVTLSPDVPLADAKYFAIYCKNLNLSFSMIKLPPSAPNWKNPEQIVLGDFVEPSATEGVKGSVKVLSSQAFELTGFEFKPGDLKNVFFMVGTTEKPDDSGGEQLPNEEYKDPPEPITKDYAAGEHHIIIKLSQDKTYCMYKWFGLYDMDGKKSLGYVALKEGKIPPEVGQTPGEGWGPMTTTVGPGGGGGTETVSTEETTEEDSTTSERTEGTKRRSRPPRPRQEITFPTTTKKPNHANVNAESSYGIILTATTFIFYFYH